MSKEAIIRLTSDRIKIKGGEYVCDLVRCQDCNKTEKRATEEVGHKYCSILTGWVDDNFYCGYGEVRDE